MIPIHNLNGIREIVVDQIPDPNGAITDKDQGMGAVCTTAQPVAQSNLPNSSALSISQKYCLFLARKTMPSRCALSFCRIDCWRMGTISPSYQQPTFKSRQVSRFSRLFPSRRAVRSVLWRHQLSHTKCLALAVDFVLVFANQPHPAFPSPTSCLLDVGVLPFFEFRPHRIL